MKPIKPIIKINVKKVKTLKKKQLEPIKIIVDWKPEPIYI